ncbi:DUF6691 family protein, partial [Rhizobium ruizarguesonis]
MVLEAVSEEAFSPCSYGFLNVLGAWDPSLAFVLGGAVVVAFIGVHIMKRMNRPAFNDRFHVPTNRRIDAPLVVG